MVFLPVRTVTIPSIASPNGLILPALGVLVSPVAFGMSFVACVRRGGRRLIIGPFIMMRILWCWV